MRMTGLMNIPSMDVPGMRSAKTVSGGNSSYVTTVEDVAREGYEAYLVKLEEAGFVLYAKNAAGIGETVFSATFTRGELVLTVTYYAMEKSVSIAFFEGTVSRHLIYEPSYLSGNEEGAHTKLYMREHWWFGSSFVFQLKNGHFLISDGGRDADLPYLLDDLEAWAPKGEKPVIEGWFITHAHDDHCGALASLKDHPEWRTRIVCEGVYFNEPSDAVMYCCGGMEETGGIKCAVRELRTSSGERTKLYRMQTGQKYYFNDLTIDVLLTEEQVPYLDYEQGGDLNISSTVCVFHVDGQKCFFSGDIHHEGLSFIMRNYTREYLDLTLFTSNHHGYNTYPPFGDYAKIRTALLTVEKRFPVRQVWENREFYAKVQETMMWGDGAKVLTFPYTVGSYETLPPRKWIYHEGQKKPFHPNMYTFPNRTLAGFLFDGDGLRPDAAEFLAYLKEKGVSRMAVYSSGMNTDALKAALETQGIAGYFRMFLGCDVLGEETPVRDAIVKTEADFKLDHAHKYVVVCDSLEAVEAAVEEGIRSLVVCSGADRTPELAEKSWKLVGCYAEIPRLLETYKIYPSHKDTGIIYE